MVRGLRRGSAMRSCHRGGASSSVPKALVGGGPCAMFGPCRWHSWHRIRRRPATSRRFCWYADCFPSVPLTLPTAQVRAGSHSGWRFRSRARYSQSSSVSSAVAVIMQRTKCSLSSLGALSRSGDAGVTEPGAAPTNLASRRPGARRDASWAAGSGRTGSLGAKGTARKRAEANNPSVPWLPAGVLVRGSQQASLVEWRGEGAVHGE